MGESPVRNLVISSENVADGMVMVSVSDTGSGISPEITQQLFQPFVTTKREGMGVGLSICRTIVESHNGRIWVEPNPGGGTVFRFTLRAVTQEDLSDAK
jgi:two-component system, LuxR family, sensor kinase FixL